MAKLQTSITIDGDVYKQIKKRADKETRTFSVMLEVMAKEYLKNLK